MPSQILLLKQTFRLTDGSQVLRRTMLSKRGQVRFLGNNCSTTDTTLVQKSDILEHQREVLNCFWLDNTYVKGEIFKKIAYYQENYNF